MFVRKQRIWKRLPPQLCSSLERWINREAEKSLLLPYLLLSMWTVAFHLHSVLSSEVHTASAAQLSVSWLLLCVRLLVLYDWNYATPAWTKSHKWVRGFRMQRGAILRRVGRTGWRWGTRAWDVAEVSAVINLSGCLQTPGVGCHIHPHSHDRDGERERLAK